VSDGERGILLVHCFAGCDGCDVLDELRRRGLLDDRDAERDGSTAASSQSKKSTPQVCDNYAEQQHHKAAWLWSQRRPIGGTVAETYLRQKRRIACALPPTLAFLPPSKPKHHPAMIAAFALPDEIEPGILAPPRAVTAIQLTLLKPDGSDKANIEKQKLMVGSPGGLPIVLAPVNDLGGLALAEGIEDALSVHQGTGLGTWAAGGTGFMPLLADVIPHYVEAVTIFTHDDKAGRLHAPQLAKNIAAIGSVLEVRVEGLP
jgi:hypothetical protein